MRRTAIEAGIAPSHLHGLESGSHSPTLRTLERLLAFLPSLTPEDWTGVTNRPGDVSPAHRTGHREAAHAFGMVADAIIVGHGLIRVEGLRATVADASDDTVRLALMRAACQAKGDFLRTLEVTDTVVSRGKHRHAFEWSGDLLTYERLGPTAAHWSCHFPASELRMRAPDGETATLSVRSQTGGPEIADRLHPHRRVTELVELVVDYPVVGVEYEVVVGEESWAETPGQVMRRYRKAAGLTLQQVADSGGFAVNTGSAVETGKQAPSLSTMTGYCGALPELPLRRLLPGRIDEGEPDGPSAFDQAVAVAGLVCDSIEKRLRIEADGTRHHETIIHGLRSMGLPLSERDIELPGVPSSAQVNEGVLAAIIADLETPTVAIRRTHSFPGGVLVIRWAERQGVFGATLERTYLPARSFAMTGSRARVMYGTDGPHSEGASVPVPLPARSVLLSVELPADHEHEGLRHHVWPVAVFPQRDLPPLVDAGMIPLSIESDGEVTRYTVRAKLVPAGFQLALGWRLTGY